jgi:hypothetical protein
MRIGRNDRCPCGSGEKYKRCCLGKEVRRDGLRSRTVLWVLGLVLALALLGIVRMLSDADPSSAAPSRVWSEEHGHWHTVSPGASGPVTHPLPPPGPAPPGKVWSAEHGHWHDVP